jgi:hypothetical protein
MNKLARRTHANLGEKEKREPIDLRRTYKSIITKNKIIS